jgi:hypothetical protein
MPDFSTGFESGANIVLNAKRLKQDQKRIDQEKELSLKRLDFEAQQRKQDIDNQNTLLQKRLDFEASEGGKSRAQQTSLQQGQQTFTGGQASLDREQRAAAIKAELEARAASQANAQGFQGTLADLDRQQRAQLAQGQNAERMAERQTGTFERILPDGSVAKIPMGAASLQALADPKNAAPAALSSEDAQAMEWAKANAKDPRAALILKKIGR